MLALLVQPAHVAIMCVTVKNRSQHSIGIVTAHFNIAVENPELHNMCGEQLLAPNNIAYPIAS